MLCLKQTISTLMCIKVYEFGFSYRKKCLNAELFVLGRRRRKHFRIKILSQVTVLFEITKRLIMSDWLSLYNNLHSIVEYSRNFNT